MIKRFVIIVAGGSSARMQQATPKQFLLLDNRPILAHSLSTFHAVFPSITIIVVLPKDLIQHWESLCKTYNITTPHRVIEGGETRTASVRNGLAAVPNEGIIAIHDAARPLVSPTLIKNAFLQMEKRATEPHPPAIIPGIPITDSLRRSDNDSSAVVQREHLYLVQTPQLFNLSFLKKAYHNISNDLTFSDDASLYETGVEKVEIMEGEARNIKITYPEDIAYASFLLSEDK